MTPRTEVMTIDMGEAKASAREALLAHAGYAYIPVIDGDLDKVAGMLPVRPALAALVRDEHCDLADYLVLKNVPFREAHGIVGRAVAYCLEKGCELPDLSIAELGRFSETIGKDVYEVLSVEGSVNSRISTGGTGIQRVEEALLAAEKQLGIGQ